MSSTASVAESTAVITGLALLWLLAYHSSHLWTIVRYARPTVTKATPDERTATPDEPHIPNPTAGAVVSFSTLGALIYSLAKSDRGVADMPFLCGYWASITAAFVLTHALAMLSSLSCWLAYGITTFKSALNIRDDPTDPEGRMAKQTELTDADMQSTCLARLYEVHHLVSITVALSIWVTVSFFTPDVANPFAGEWKWIHIHLMTPPSWPLTFRRTRPELATQSPSDATFGDTPNFEGDYYVEYTMVERVLRLCNRFIFTKMATTLHGIVMIGLAELDVGAPLTWLVRVLLQAVMFGINFIRMAFEMPSLWCTAHRQKWGDCHCLDWWLEIGWPRECRAGIEDPHSAQQQELGSWWYTWRQERNRLL